MKPGTRWTYRDVDEKGEVQDVVIVCHHGDQEAGQRDHSAGGS